MEGLCRAVKGWARGGSSSLEGVALAPVYSLCFWDHDVDSATFLHDILPPHRPRDKGTRLLAV